MKGYMNRYMKRSKIIAAWVGFCACVPLAGVAWAATGTVFQDNNANGTRDSGEPGIGDVRVSDGLQITTTDAQGRWTLDIEDEAVIFMVKPTGYATPVTASQIPQFY